MSFISSFDMISVVVPDLTLFMYFYSYLFAADDAAVDPNGIKTLLSNV